MIKLVNNDKCVEIEKDGIKIVLSADEFKELATTFANQQVGGKGIPWTPTCGKPLSAKSVLILTGENRAMSDIAPADIDKKEFSVFLADEMSTGLSMDSPFANQDSFGAAFLWPLVLCVPLGDDKSADTYEWLIGVSDVLSNYITDTLESVTPKEMDDLYLSIEKCVETAFYKTLDLPE